MKIIIVLILLSLPLFGRQQFVSKIPNGDINTCFNCHVTPEGGDDRNSFGIDFAKNGLVWDSILAKIDSDNDGFTNGSELLDPNGIWKYGTVGDLSFLSLPGNSNSKPTNIVFEDYNQYISISNGAISLNQNDEIINYVVFDYLGRVLEIHFPFENNRFNAFFGFVLVETKRRTFILRLPLH